MNFYYIDTHTHLYLLSEEEADRTVQNAIQSGVKHMYFPHVDLESTLNMHNLAERYPYNCFLMMGLHPTSVLPETVDTEMKYVEEQLATQKYIAIGEIGMDLYWDKTHIELQMEIFRKQCRLALKYKLPIVVHSRDAVNELIEILSEKEFQDVTGVFHSFSGNLEQAQKIVELGFYLGISGVVTYKNSTLPEVLKNIDIKHILLETDAPYLPPVPFRGKQNESAYLVYVAAKLAEIYQTNVEAIAQTTSLNATNLFNTHMYV